MSTVSDPLVMPLARDMLACLELEMSKVPDPPLHVGLRPGVTVDLLMSMHENECCNGLAWVRPDTISPSSTTFPLPDTTPLKTGTRAWAITFELGAVRCAPVPNERTIPSTEEWNKVTEAVMDDAAALRRTICCFIDADPQRRGRVLPGTWQPVAVEGGCVGGIIPVTVMGPACDCADAGDSS